MLDLAAVRRFTDELDENIRRCDNGEGTVCSNLEQTIGHYAGLCNSLRGYIDQWARAIFSGQIAFDQDIEDLFKKEAKHLLHRAKQIAMIGRKMQEQCFALEGLHPLNDAVLDLDYLLENWVRPRRAVSPAPRGQEQVAGTVFLWILARNGSGPWAPPAT